MTFEFNPIFPEATNQEKWDQIRLWRNSELKATDWTQLDDAPVNKADWAQYRQELRNLPQLGGLAEEVIIPNRPE